MSQRKNPLLFYILIAIVAAVAIIVYLSFTKTDPPKELVIAGKDSFESSIAVEMIAIELENLGISVKRKFNKGVTSDLISELEKDSIHIYPDYTGTFLSEIMNDPTLANDERNHTYEQLNYILETRTSGRPKYKILYPAKNLDSSYEIVMPRDSAIALLGADTTLSGLSKVSIPEHYEFGFTRDFDSRPDAGQALSRVYGIKFPDRQTIFLHHSRKYEKLQEGAIQIADGYSTDEEYVFKKAYPSFVFLEDDKGAFPHYYLVPIVRRDVLDWNKEVEPELKKLMSRIDLEAVARITTKVKEKGVTLEMLESSLEAQRVLNETIKEYYKNESAE
jgi:glycine betaine/choline ABC-type transport system substrate-binding protein